MQRGLTLLLCAAAFLWARPASANDRPPYLVYLGFGASQLAQQARDYLTERMLDLTRWLEGPARIHSFPGVSIQPWPAPRPVPAGPRVLAIVTGSFGGPEQNRAEGQIDIGNSRSLSLLANPASRFNPVRGVVRIGPDGNLRTRMGMYETIILYSLLVRAFEQADGRLFAGVERRLNETINRTRIAAGAPLSHHCLRQVAQNAAQMRQSWSQAARARAVSLPPKDIRCEP